MENEENRGLLYKKAFEDQLVPFVSAFFGSLSLFSLAVSHSWTLRISWIILALDQERQESKKEEGESKEEQDQVATT